MHDHCNSTPRTTSTPIPKRLKIEAQPNSFVKIVDVPVPGIMEEILELIQLVPQERIPERIVEEISDVPVPEVMEKTVEVGKHSRQEGMQSYTVEQIVGAPFPQTQKEIREVTQLIPQERISDRFVEQTAYIPRPRKFRRRKSVSSAGTELTSDRDFANAELRTAMENTLRCVRRETQS